MFPNRSVGHSCHGWWALTPELLSRLLVGRGYAWANELGCQRRLAFCAAGCTARFDGNSNSRAMATGNLTGTKYSAG